MVRSQAPGAGSVDPADHPAQPFSAAAWQSFSHRVQELGLPDQTPLRPAWEAIYGHLQGVNQWLNLTRVDSEEAYLQRHVLDSLMLLQMPWFLSPSSLRCADLGSGGGYPGLPLALTVPQHHWLLIDSRQRKVRFLAAAATLIDGERVRARAFRAGHAPHEASDCVAAFDLVTTRATGTVEDIATEALPLLRRGGRLVVWQGPLFDEAAEKSLRHNLLLASTADRGPWEALAVHRYQLHAADPQRCLVILSRRGKAP